MTAEILNPTEIHPPPPTPPTPPGRGLSDPPAQVIVGLAALALPELLIEIALVDSLP